MDSAVLLILVYLIVKILKILSNNLYFTNKKIPKIERLKNNGSALFKEKGHYNIEPYGLDNLLEAVGTVQRTLRKISKFAHGLQILLQTGIRC